MRQPRPARGRESRWHHGRPLVLHRMLGRFFIGGRHARHTRAQTGRTAMTLGLLTIVALVGCLIVSAAILAAVYFIAQDRDLRKRRE